MNQTYRMQYQHPDGTWHFCTQFRVGDAETLTTRYRVVKGSDSDPIRLQPFSVMVGTEGDYATAMTALQRLRTLLA
jgi:hypothetical protein